MKKITFLYLDKIQSFQDLKKLNYKQLNQLASEIRQKLIEMAAKQKIHLGSNLGVVELTIALMLEVDHLKQKLLYDTGHQCYVHKILTGRYFKIDSIRQEEGLSGFPSPEESIYDFISSGHSSTSLAIAQGFNETSDELQVIPIIGDAAISNGMALEALNDIGFKQNKMLIIINDNGESISKSVGSLNKIMSQMQPHKKNQARQNFLRKAKTSIFNQNIFESLGFEYIGPIDGHDLLSIQKNIRQGIEKSNFGPVILHLKTIKSKGFLKEKQNNHSIMIGENFNFEAPTAIAANYLKSLLEKKYDLQIINSAMTIPGFYEEIAQKFPWNYQDVGINEEHAVTKASGMALNQKKVIIPIYSTFLQRTYDQILHDVARLNLPIIFLVDRAEISAQDGDTHHGIYDVGMLKSIPNTIISTPSNQSELINLINLAIQNPKNPFFIRFANEKFLNDKNCSPFKIGDWIKVNDINSSRVIISYGNVVNRIIQNFANKADIINAIFQNNFDEKKIIEMLKKYKTIIFYERIFDSGTLYKDVTEIFNKNQLKDYQFFNFSFKNMHIGHGLISRIDEREKMNLSLIDKILN